MNAAEHVLSHHFIPFLFASRQHSGAASSQSYGRTVEVVRQNRDRAEVGCALPRTRIHKDITQNTDACQMGTASRHTRRSRVPTPLSQYSRPKGSMEPALEMTDVIRFYVQRNGVAWK